MDNSQHTPGPWFVTPADDWRDSDGRWVQYGNYLISAGSDKLRDERYYRIAEVSNVNDSPKNEANARLIAAAPELLEACKAACNCIGELSPTQARVEVAQMLQAAIAAATGSTHE